MIKTYSLFKKYFLISAAVTLLTSAALGGVLLLVSSKHIFDSENKFQIILIMLVFVALIISANAFVLYSMFKKLTKTLEQITKLSDSIASGEFQYKVPASGIKEFHQLELSLNSLAETVQKSDKVKNQFVSNVCHELRTPLTSVSGFIDGIIDGTIPPDKEPQYLRLISNEVKRLTRLTNLLLNLEQLESGAIKPVMQNTDVISIIVDILNTFEKNINKKNIEILGLDAENITVFADRDMLYQVMYNLIENAVKFTPESGYIEFKFSEDEKYSKISVKNNGEGLTESECKKVFNRFYKTDSSRAKDTIGAGLGLNIVKSIISIHKGTIDVDSVKGKYTQFTFLVPKTSI